VSIAFLWKLSGKFDFSGGNAYIFVPLFPYQNENSVGCCNPFMQQSERPAPYLIFVACLPSCASSNSLHKIPVVIFCTPFFYFLVYPRPLDYHRLLSSSKVGATCGWVPVYCSHRRAFCIPTHGYGIIDICFGELMELWFAGESRIYGLGKHSKRNFSQCHFNHQKSQIDYTESEFEIPEREAGE
jgi:hypothetical protein